jgi:hypothetical protein
LTFRFLVEHFLAKIAKKQTRRARNRAERSRF